MGYSPVYQLKQMASIPNIYGNTLTGHIYNAAYNEIRARFWSRLASKNERLGRFFRDSSPEVEEPKLEDLSVARSVEEASEAVLKYGVAIVDKFLTSAEKSLFVERSLQTVSGVTNAPYGTIDNYSSSYSENCQVGMELRRFCSSVTERLLCDAKPERVRVTIQRLVRRSNIYDEGDPNTEYHSDRFIPTLKFFYYPFGVSKGNATFGFKPFSHLINKEFSEAYSDFYKRQAAGNCSRYPCALDFFANVAGVEMAVPENSLVIAATHGMHRRGYFSCERLEVPQERLSAQMLVYNQQTKLSLLG